MEQYYLSLIRGERRGLWPRVQRGGLRLLSLPYALAMRLRNLLFDLGWKKSYAVAVPVISVGNLTVGGTGKTPCVEYIARWYREQDWQVAILSRGYGSQQGPNDEALLLEENLPDVPHLQGGDRVSLARIAVDELESNVLVLDDGFQHRRLRRSLDVVLVDATCPWGHGWTLPGGLLREPLAGLKRAGVIVLTRCDQVEAVALQQIREALARWVPQVPVVLTTHAPVTLVNAEAQELGLEALHGQPVAVFCGIGNPEAFRHTLHSLQAEIAAFRHYPDHHTYTRTDIDELRCWARQQAKDCVVVTTQKDLVKIRLTQLGERQLWAVRIQLHITEGREVLDRKLKEALA